LLVSKRGACFLKKWESDLEKEIPDYNKLTIEARKVMGLDGEGKPLIARFIATKLAKQKPPFIPPSLKAIISQASKIQWESTCLVKKQQ
jgi:hypothetical protein